MLNKKKFTLVLILFLMYPINLFSKSEVIIVTKIDDQIITNFDITQEANYLIALNNNLENIEKSNGKYVEPGSILPTNQISKARNLTG